MIALIVTPEGLPLAYDVLPGNTADSKTLRTFLGKVEKQYGKARPSYLGGIEREVENPTVDLLERLAKALDVPLSDLFVGISPKAPKSVGLKRGRRGPDAG